MLQVGSSLCNSKSCRWCHKGRTAVADMLLQQLYTAALSFSCLSDTYSSSCSKTYTLE